MSSHRTVRSGSILVCLLALACLSCFEPPVRETMEIVFHPEGPVEITISTRISEDDRLEKNAAASARIQEVREAALRGEDPLNARVRALDPVIEKVYFEFHEGRLVEASRNAVVEDPAGLLSLFDFAPVGAFLQREGDVITLEFQPTGSDRATPRQARTVLESLDGFSESVAAYAQAAADLYRYLDDHPERDRACLEDLFKDFIEESARRDEDLHDGEAALLRSVKERMSDVWDVLNVRTDEAYTLDEMSRLLFDPFPAEVEVEVTGTIEEIAGFERKDATRVAIPAIGLWSALTALEGRWIEPDLVLAYVESGLKRGDAPFDLDGFVGRRRAVHGVPRGPEVREALMANLRPAEVYRLRWRVPPELDEPRGEGPTPSTERRESDQGGGAPL